ncbi:MAG: tetratricopeptide repeat protein [Acidimicrobiia bacterium]|nr:tetratricopeptide repeat protein [Acidimicrobiia bacterium]
MAFADLDHHLLLEQAGMMLAAGRLADARAAYQRAIDAAEQAGDGDALGEAVLGLAGLWVNEQRGPDEFATFQLAVDQAMRATTDPLIRARLRLRGAVDARYGADGSQDDVWTAVDELRRLDDPRALANGLSLVHHTLLAPEDAEARAAILGELTAVAARAANPYLTLVGVLWTTIDAFLEGRPDAARSLQHLRAKADELGNGVIRYVTRTIEVMAMLRAGQLDDVELLLDDLLRFGTDVGETDAFTWYSAQLLTLRWYQGRATELLPAMGDLANSPVLTRFNRAYLATSAALAAEAGAEDEARVALAGVAPFDGPPHGLAQSSVWLGTMFAVVEACAHLGDVQGARQAYEALLPYAHLPLMSSFAVTCAGSTHRSLGLCARTTGDIDLAIDHLERAVADDLRFGNRPMLAITRAELAALLLQRGAPEDRSMAVGLYEQALATAEEIGMTGWADRWRSARPGDAPQAPDQGRFVRNGDVWEVAAGSERALVAHSIGMSMLAVLIASPGQDVTVGELTGAPAEASDQPLLDEETRQQVRRRLLDLQSDIDEADADADIERASRLRAELDALVDELTRTTGLGGRSRSFAGASERARTSVQKAIRRALDRIGEQAPGLAKSLAESVRTGTRCRFDPTEGLPAVWRTRE